MMPPARPVLVSVIGLACLLPAGGVSAAAGDELAVTGSIVNLRAGPSLDADVLMRLEQGRVLVELDRRSKWVHVSTGRDDIRSGWIYADLVRVMPEAQDAKRGNEEDTVDDLVALFKQALAEYNTRKNRESGYAYFIEPEYTGDGVIVVTGTEPWLQLPMEQRMEDLADVFEIWAAAVGEGPPITINVMDAAGEKQMTMYR